MDVNLCAYDGRSCPQLHGRAAITDATGCLGVNVR